jgi:hypothetical protein
VKLSVIIRSGAISRFMSFDASAFLSHCGLMAIRDVLHGMLFSEVALKV